MRVSAVLTQILVALRSIRRRPVRSLLNALTATVAIGTTVTTMALIAGSRRIAEHDLRALGSLTVQIHPEPMYPAGGPRPVLDDEALREVREAAGDAAVEIVPARIIQFSARAAERPPVLLPVVATAPGYLAMYDGRLRAGRWLDDEDVRQARPVAVVDEEAARSLFGRLDVIGRRVDLRRAGESLEVEVVGVLEDPISLREHVRPFDTSRGARHVVARLLSFENVHVPSSLLPDRPYTAFLGRAPDRDRAPDLKVAMRAWVAKAAEAVGADPEGPRPLFVWSRGEWIADVLETIGDFSMLGGVIWALVLLVAMVMIMTVNLVAVRERYPEVAIRRTEGATRSDIVLQFTIEGMLVSLIGGIAGLGLGWASTGILAGLVDWAPAFETPDLVLAVGLAALVGLGGSALPARRAARLDPVVVLSRHRE